VWGDFIVSKKGQSSAIQKFHFSTAAAIFEKWAMLFQNKTGTMQTVREK
jgi:hypothetical protein